MGTSKIRVVSQKTNKQKFMGRLGKPSVRLITDLIRTVTVPFSNTS